MKRQREQGQEYGRALGKMQVTEGGLRPICLQFT